MPTLLTATQYQQMIVAELNLDPTAQSLVPLMWDMYQDQGDYSQSTVGLRLQYLYCKRQAIDYLIGQRYQKVDRTQAATDQKNSQVIKALEDMRKTVQDEIDKLESKVQDERAPAISLMQGPPAQRVRLVTEPLQDWPTASGLPVVLTPLEGQG